MAVLAIVLAILLILIVLIDAFETVILPRRVTRPMSLARLFYQITWALWTRLVRTLVLRRHQETYLSFYGPLSLIILLLLWANMLLFGFALLHWGSGSIVHSTHGTPSFATYVYLSGTTFFTLGIGDVVPMTSMGRAIIAFEAGVGIGFLALVIGYLPQLNQSFSRREVTISLLDARAGSLPTAAEMLYRHSHDRGMEELRQLLHEWERWAAELMESHLAYPALAYFRSHHNNQSWLAALTAILDTCAFAIVNFEGTCGACERQAQLTFAITRHAVVDLAYVLNCPPQEPTRSRLSSAELSFVCRMLTDEGLKLNPGTDCEDRLLKLRKMYEPYVFSLANHLHVTIPPWVPESSCLDDWQTSTWGNGKACHVDEQANFLKDKRL